MKNKRSMMESEYDTKDIIVIDNGSDSVKIGISGEDNPRLILDSVCGIPNILQESDSLNNKPQLLFGQAFKNALKEKKYDIQTKYPISEGKIDNMDQMRDMWIYALEEGLQISELSSVNLLIIDQCKNPKDYKHKIAEVLFEYLKVHSVLFMNSSSLSLFSTGSVRYLYKHYMGSGLSLELGHAVNTVVPIFQGFPITHALQYSYVSGDVVTKTLFEDLKQKNITLGYSDLENQVIIKNIKERMCSVSLDYNSAVLRTIIEYNPRLSQWTTFQKKKRAMNFQMNQLLQSMHKLGIDAQKLCLSMRFNQMNLSPSIVGMSGFSLPEMMLDSLTRCDTELQGELQRNIVIGGGTSMFKGLLPRIQKDLTRLLPRVSKSELSYVADSQRKYSAWIGGSMMGSLSTFQQLAILRTDYEENPESKVSIIHKRTF